MHGITGAPTATTAFVGFAAKGPVNAPTAIESVAEYEASFGKIASAQPLSSAVEAFFRNGGSRAVILRTSPGRTARHRADGLIGSAETGAGLYALQRERDGLGVLLIPDAAYLPVDEAERVTKAAVAFSQAQAVFHIADVPDDVASRGLDAVAQWGGRAVRSRNLAVYYPWLSAPGSAKGQKPRLQPAAPAAAGIFARTDQASGVWKAPAGREASIVGVTGLAKRITEADAQTLQDVSINAVRQIAGTGIVLWGARTFATEDEADWRYLNVRRLALFLENSIHNSLSGVTFEPNGEALWAQIRLEIAAFLHTAWRAGAFQGARPEDSYFVRCDTTTVTRDDLANGRLTAMVGFAPLRSAEFVILRIGFHAA